MTYHYKYWSAFSEADLLIKGDNSLSTGDTFVMPAASTVTLASYDNDGQLSGDSNGHATDSDGSHDQYGWANDGTGWVRTGDLYVDTVYTLHGSDGKTYYLAEIEGENKAENEDFFSFVGATPPAGVTLKIGAQNESHGVNYSDLSADPSEAPANTGPVFDNLPENGVIHLEENNKDVIDVNASDADGDTLTYSISGGADGALFEINAHTGELSFIKTPDFENPHDVSGHNNVYDVTITVTDGNGGTATKPLWIKITDVDEHVNTAPVFDNLPVNGVICIDENITHVVDINASDVDGDTLTYAITGGADAGDFSINAHTGELTFNVAPDFENPHDGSGHNNVYDVTITVTDGNGGTTTKPLWIKIKDVDEHVNTAPVLSGLPDNGVICIDENGNFVVDVNASDVDGDTLTYSITGGADAANFTIDAHTGELTFINAPDFENPTDNNSGNNNVYDVTVTVTDGNGGSDTKPLWVKVKDVDETTGELECIVIEAEDMDLHGMSIQHGSQASGGQLVRTSHLGGTGDLTTTFNGDGGTYDLSIFAQDETDGASSIMVKVNGVLVEAFKLDRQTDGGGSNNSGFTEFVIEGVDLMPGDEIMVWVDGDAGEWVRIDKLKLQQTAEVNPDLVCLDFEGLAAGTVVNQQFDGVMISAQRATHNTAENDAMIFDSNNPTGGDHDLETDNQNNILIVSEDNDSSDPDDAIGGTIWFKFDNPSYIDSIKVIDAEEGGTIRLLDENGQLIKTVTIPGGTDGGIQTVDIDAEGVAQIDLTLNGSGAIDDLKYIPGEAPETASLGGTYFMDNNDNSVEDAGDMVIAGATVWLIKQGEGIVATTTTDADGNYLFEGLDAANYMVRFDEQDGKTYVDANVGGDDTIDSDVTVVGGAGNGNTDFVTVNAGDDIRNVDAGVEVVDSGDAQISGRITFDADDDDTENAAGGGFDEGFGGKTVELLNEAGDVVATTTTNADGSYAFTGLDAGTYSVNFPDTMGLTIADKDVGGENEDSDANANGQTDPIVVAIGDNIPNIDLSLQDPADASLGGRIFHDSDDDSQDNGNGNEAPAAGVTVRLLDANGVELATTTTDANGEYLFENLKAGDYKVDFPTEVDGKILVDQNVGNDLSDSDADQGTGETGVVSVGISENVRDVDAGVEDPGTAAINGRLFMDNNDNSQDDAGDMAVAGVEVELLDENGDVIATATTNGNGEYSFTNLGAGDYSVRFPEEVDGKVLVEQNVGPDATDSDADQNTGETGTISLEIGDVSNDNDAGIEDPAGSAIEGVVFMDNNDNSQNDAGDMPVSGVPVELLNEAGDVIGTTTTGADGSYSFTGLDAGTYSVNFPTEVDGKVLVNANVGDDTSDSDADTTTGNTGPITVGINETSSNNDAGIEDPGTARIGNLVFLDNDGNGRLSAGDERVEGVTVELLNEAGDVIETATTNANGFYFFDNLDAGIYSVKFTAPDGLEFTTQSTVAADAVNNDSDADLVTGETGQVELSIGETEWNLDAGLVASETGDAEINGRVFMDNNDNSQDDAGDMGVAGVPVDLLDENGDVIASTTTGADGSYTFGGLDAGTYSVDFPTEVDGKVLVDANVGPDGTDSDADEATGTTGDIVLGIGEVSNDNDAGIEDPGTASLGNLVFLDNNGDGVFNAGDERVDGVVVELLDENGDVIADTTTNANGLYNFSNLDAGVYSVRFTAPDGLEFTTEGTAADDARNNDSDADQDSGETDQVTLSIGEAERDVDAGLVVSETGDAVIEGRVFMDNNDNDQDDAGDMGVAGVPVDLLDEGGNVIGSTTTGPDGSYSFGGLDAGTYSVTFPTTTADGKVLVDSNVGPDGTDSDADQGTGNTGPITVGIGETSSNNDAGVEDPGTASLAGVAFMDNNDNDQNDAGDMIIAGVAVQLLDINGDVIGNTTTGPDGSYEFTGLDAGSYSVRFPTDVDGKVLVDNNVGSDVTDSDADQGNGETSVVELGIGERSENNDAGFEDPGTAAIGDTVFIDENGNGQQDVGEQGVEGVEVTVFDSNGDIAGTATTDDEGKYLVSGLDAGTYTVGFENVDGFDFTTANQGPDGTDSDADETTGLTGPVTLDIGETDLTVDAGIVAENEAPIAGDDEGMVCATEAVSINVLENDADADGDALSVAHVNGQDIAVGESVTLDSGATVTLLANGELSYDSSTAVIGGVPADEIVQGETATDSFTYSVTDGNGGTDTGEVNVTLKGDMDTIETILESAPTSGTATFTGYSTGTAYSATLSGTGDARYDGLTIDQAYCLEREDDYFANTDVSVNISGALDDLQNSADYSSNVVDNLDLINWIINQDFTSQSNGDTSGVGAGLNFTDAEIQSAIWGITDGDSRIVEGLVTSIENGQFVQTYNGTQENVETILQLAIDNGEGFEAGEGDLFTLVLNPTEVQAGVDEANDADQAFIVALPFDDFKEDCIC